MKSESVSRLLNTTDPSGVGKGLSISWVRGERTSRELNRGIRLPSTNGGQLGLGRARGLLHDRVDLHVPAGLLAHLVDRVPRVDGSHERLPAALRKAEDAQRRDDRHRPAAEDSVALAPAWRAVAVTRRRHK